MAKLINRLEAIAELISDAKLEGVCIAKVKKGERSGLRQIGSRKTGFTFNNIENVRIIKTIMASGHEKKYFQMDRYVSTDIGGFMNADFKEDGFYIVELQKSWNTKINLLFRPKVLNVGIVGLIKIAVVEKGKLVENKRWTEDAKRRMNLLKLVRNGAKDRQAHFLSDFEQKKEEFYEMKYTLAVKFLDKDKNGKRSYVKDIKDCSGKQLEENILRCTKNAEDWIKAHEKYLNGGEIKEEMESKDIGELEEFEELMM